MWSAPTASAAMATLLSRSAAMKKPGVKNNKKRISKSEEPKAEKCEDKKKKSWVSLKGQSPKLKSFKELRISKATAKI